MNASESRPGGCIPADETHESTRPEGRPPRFSSQAIREFVMADMRKGLFDLDE